MLKNSCAAPRLAILARSADSGIPNSAAHSAIESELVVIEPFTFRKNSTGWMHRIDGNAVHPARLVVGEREIRITKRMSVGSILFSLRLPPGRVTTGSSGGVNY
jgi:hypothetical protein